MSTAAPLTEQQTAARDTRDVSVALDAGAGCGKTFVLTERFLAHLDPTGGDAPPPAELHKLIAITFTDAAAREMRLRIRAKCHQRLQEAGTDADQRYWLGMLRAIEAARVSTIHAFCTALLRTHAVEAGLDPTFGVLDQPAADVLLSEVLDDVLRERLGEQQKATLQLAATYGLSRLKQQLAELLKQRHYGLFQRWHDATPEQLVTAWQDVYDRAAFPAAVAQIAARAPIHPIVELLRSVDPPAKKQAFVAARALLLDLLPRLADGRVTQQQLEDIHGHARVQKICTAKDWPTKEAYDEYKSACEVLRKSIDDHRPPPFEPAAAHDAAALGLDLLRLAEDVAAAYQDAKQAQAKLDFDDQLALAHRLIQGSESIRRRYARDLRLLLVDEFQDTDRLQLDLIQELCGEALEAGKLFFVGDYKQSIYRFRQAEPENFRTLRDRVPEKGRLPLTENFRSQPAILHFVNALFCDAFAEYEPLRPHRRQTTTGASVEFLWTPAPDKDARQKGAKQEARRQEARSIARRLRQLIDASQEVSGEKPIVDRETGQPRGVRPGDVAILFRALSDVQHYEEALRDYGLDYYLVGGHAFYSQQEIYDVLNLLRAVATPADEISLAGVLRSPFFALADESLFWLAESAGSLNAGLGGDPLPAQLSSEERAKTAAAAHTIDHLRAIKDSVPIATLLGEALARTGYDAALLAEFLGRRKLANLHKLIEQARAADRGGEMDLDGFITELAQFTADQPKEALAATRFESADVIRLMTIHHAKGLEFPFVVLPDLDREPNWMTPPAALHPDLGPLVPHPNEDEKKQVATGMTLFKALESVQDAEERKRLLYVACTRAADYLILSSSLASHDKPKSDWMQLVGERFDLSTGQLRARLPEGYQSPHILVTDPKQATARKPTGAPRGVDVVRALDEARQLAARGEGTMPHEVAPVAVDLAAREQYSFSRLTGQLVRHDPLQIAAADQAPEDSAVRTDVRQLGSLVHAVLERIDVRGENPIGRWCEQLAPQLVDENAEQAAELARQMVERFVASPRWRQMAAAATIEREIELLLAWPPGSSGGSGSASEHTWGRYLRGFIDCLYQDADGGWHLVDYKTNDVAADHCAEAAGRYEMQLGVYAMAVERSLGKPPVELVLHFLRPGAEHVFPWDDAARRRTVDAVNQAIEKGLGSGFRNDTRSPAPSPNPEP